MLKVLSSQASKLNVPPTFWEVSEGVVLAFLAEINEAGLVSIPCFAGDLPVGEAAEERIDCEVTGIFSSSGLEILLASATCADRSGAGDRPLED